MNVKEERAERLAARLRENLRRRKTQAREMRSGEGEVPSEVGGELKQTD